MILDKVLLLKGLGGVAACTGVGCGGLYLINPDLFKSNDQILADLISKVGLDCKTPSAAGRECTKVNTEGSKIKVNQGGDNGKFEIDTLSAGSGTSGKIKVYANNSDYNKGFKFVIEDGNITKDSKTLEQFETYEIKQDDGDKKWYLTRKSTAIEEIKKALGLPSTCTLATNETTDSCTGITAEQLKTINFKDKGTGQDVNVASGATTKLTIVNSSDTDFPFGYKFIFKTTGDVTIPKAEENQQITIKANIDTEFKIKKTENKLTLEKAWNITEWGKKVGLTCPADGGTKECTLPTTETNLKLYNGANDKVENGKVSDNTKKLKYEEDKEGYNQGFKFFAESEITLANGNSSKKIEASGTATYEIKKVENEWYLAKKSNGN